jgi:NAD(P)-dependent dehydrogenase (short-subunit alcohol dehydrogenase family)
MAADIMTHKKVLETFRLDGRVALITGGARGLGRTMAIALGEAGADVALAGRSRESCEATAAEIGGITGRAVRAFAADVTKAAEVTRLAGEVGRVDILVNNAGTNIRGTIDKLTESDWDTVVDINLKGPFLCAKAIAPQMIERGWGRVINIASALSVIGLPGRAPYASSKAGVLGLTKVLALEWANTGVTCNAICPGPFATDMNRQLLNDPQAYQQFISLIPMGRWGELDELAGVIVFLASDASSFMTGSPIFVDGGWTAR